MMEDERSTIPPILGVWFIHGNEADRLVCAAHGDVIGLRREYADVIYGEDGTIAIKPRKREVGPSETK